MMNTLSHPPVHLDAPIVFPTVDLAVQLTLEGGPEPVEWTLAWREGRPRFEIGVIEHDLHCVGPVGLLIPYLCGLLDSHHLFAGAAVTGDVAALSALHGLTHEDAVTAFWAQRCREVDGAIAAIREDLPPG